MPSPRLFLRYRLVTSSWSMTGRALTGSVEAVSRTGAHAHDNTEYANELIVENHTAIPDSVGLPKSTRVISWPSL